MRACAQLPVVGMYMETHLKKERLCTSNRSSLQHTVHMYIHLPPAFLLSLRVLPGIGLQWTGGEMAASFTL